MHTNSVIIKKVTAFFLWLNFYFEHSFIFKCLNAVKRASRTSHIVNEFKSTDYRDYFTGSIIMRVLGFVFGGIFAAVGWLFRLFCRLNEGSLNKRFVQAIINSKTVQTCFPVRLARSAGLSLLKVSYMIFIFGALMVPSHLWNNMLILLSAVFFAGVCALKFFMSGEKLDFKNISPALVLFVFFCILSIFTGYGGMDSVRVFIIFFACVIHSVLVSIIFKEKNDFRMMFIFMAFMLVFVSLFGFYQMIMGIEIRAELTDLGVNPGLSRLYSTMGNPNNDAQVWAMLLPFVIAAAITVKSDFTRLILIGAIFIALAALGLTYSRAGYVALAAGMGVFILMTAPRLVPIAIVALLLAIPFIPAAILDRLFTLGQDTSSQYRFLIWGGVMRMLEDFWVQGIGMGPAAFIRIYRSYAHPLAERALHSHNTFLDIISHSGIGALLAFLVYLFRLFKRGISSHISSRDIDMKIYIAAGIASLTVFIAFGVGEYVWFLPRVMLVFWAIAGMVISMASMDSMDSMASMPAMENVEN
ncbi:MAG: O-antigen ligase family protein [Defluviitaleaceae bacterium]|nr:O-antigen ligase family protein [Defluviitaleaceae bacterium]